MTERSLGVEVFDAMRTDIATIRDTEGYVAAVRAGVGNGAILLTILPYTAGGLETTLATVGAQVFQHAEGHNTAAAIGLVAVALGATSGVIELALSKGLSHTMARLPGAARVLERRKYGEITAEREADTELGLAIVDISEDTVAHHGLGKVWAGIKQKTSAIGQRFKSGAETTSLAMGAGSPGIMLRSFVEDPGAEPGVHRNKGYRTAGVLAIVNTATGAAYGTLLTGASTLDEVQSGLGERTLDVLSHPVTWLGTFALLKAKPYIDAAERTAWQATGRTFVFRGDQLEYQDIAAEVATNKQFIDAMLGTPRQTLERGK
jgi:hypothetical protein